MNYREQTPQKMFSISEVSHYQDRMSPLRCAYLNCKEPERM